MFPVPGGGLTHASAEIATPFGKSAIAWSLRGIGALAAQIIVAPGARGRFVPPPGDWTITLGGAPTASLTLGLRIVVVGAIAGGCDCRAIVAA